MEIKMEQPPPEQNSSGPMVVNVSDDLAKKLEDIENEKNDRIAKIKEASGGTSTTASNSPPTPDQPVEDLNPDITKYAVNDYTNMQDEVDELLNEVFRDAIYHPEASPENTFPFVQVMLKVRAMNLANAISAVENGDEKMAAGLGRVMGTLKGIWDTFRLDNNQSRQHLIDAVNGRIAELHEKPEIMKHELSIVQKAMQDLEQKYNVPNAKRNTFGAGIL